MNLLVIFSVTLLFFLTVILLMASGVLLGRREISGSCGGLGNQGEIDQSSCSLCENPDAACRELKRRMQGETSLQNEDDSAELAKS